MGAKTWMLAHSDGPPRRRLLGAGAVDRKASSELARRLFPKEQLDPLPDGTLLAMGPSDDELVVASFGALSLAAAKEFAVDRPSELPARFLNRERGGMTYLHAMHSVVDWFAFAVWHDAKLVRSLSVSPDSGIIEDIGPRLPFEEPYWDCERPAVDPDDEGEGGYPLAFHPLELGEAALAELFGYQLEGDDDSCALEPHRVSLPRFKRHRSPSWRRWFGAA